MCLDYFLEEYMYHAASCDVAEAVKFFAMRHTRVMFLWCVLRSFVALVSTLFVQQFISQ